MRTHRRRLLIIAALCLAGLCIVGGIYLWQNLVFTGETRVVPGTQHRFLVQAGVTEDDLALVAEAITLADRYFTAQLGVTLPTPIEIRMASTTPCIPFEPPETSSTAIADKSAMCVNTRGYTWTNTIPRQPLVELSIIAHEYFHNLQGQFGCLPGPDDHEYAWWVEGSATYVGWHVFVEADMLTEAEVVETMRHWGGFSDELGSLGSYEQRMPGDPEYALAYRAIALLVERTGTQSLIQFCQQIGEGENWRAAFEDAYGISVADFYMQFEAQRRG